MIPQTSVLDELLPTGPVQPLAEVVAADAAAAETSGPKTDRDIQRGALRDLVALAAESATAESEIEREYRTSQEQAKKDYSDRTFSLDQRHVQAQAESKQKLQSQLSSIEAAYKSEKNKLAVADKANQQKLDAEKRAIDAKLKKKYDDSVWLADSVLESANNQAAVAYKEKSEQVNATIEDLTALEVRSLKLLQDYGVPIPTDAPVVEEDPTIATDADAAFATHKAAVDHQVTRLGRMPLANLFVGGRPFIITIILTILAGIAVQLSSGDFTELQGKQLGIFAGGTFGLCVVLLVIFRVIATRQVRAAHEPVRKSLVLARQAAEKQLTNAAEKRKADVQAAQEARNTEVKSMKDQVTPIAAKAAAARTAGLTAAAGELSQKLARLEKGRENQKAEADEAYRRQLHDLEHKKQKDIKDAAVQDKTRTQQIEERYVERKTELENRWKNRLHEIQEPMDGESDVSNAPVDWNDPAWKTWMPNKKFASRVRFGEMQVDLSQIAENVPKNLKLPDTFSLPALLAFPAQASLLIHTDHAGRMPAINALQMVMTRLLTSLPAGRVRFVMIDPVSLGQNFAGFMHLQEFDDQLVGGKIWTSQDQIDQKLAGLAEHMETVIQKYLRNEFSNIDDYNAQAGELAEPYRFLVIADLPVNFSTEAFRRLNSIAASGARCGVYTLISRDMRAGLPAGANLDELKAHSVNIIRKDDRFVWDDDIFRQLPLTLDPPPTDDQLTSMLLKVGAGAKEAKRVEVPFAVIAPTPDKVWTGSTSAEIDVPVGRMGANRFQSLKLGKGVSQHVLIAGKTGSGKSTLMHAMITNACLWYSPDEVELYLVDFKKGVEFKTYAHNLLPHARAIAVESDREFGLSLLTKLDVELARRGELFRKAGVQDLISYRRDGNSEVVPRTLLIIDEFQEFFTEDDKLAQEAALLIERLVRQGRAFGMHVLLGSQTIGGAGGLPRAVLSQFGVRIALQTSEADSQMILGDNNSAAKLLTRPGEAIYNDANGAVEGNSPFQVAYLSDKARDVYLIDLASKAEPYFKRFGYPIVFEGNAAAEIRRNVKLMNLLDAPQWPATVGTIGASGWLGDPVAIKDPPAIQFRRQSGTNVLIVGQAEEQSMAMISEMIVGIAAQQSPSQAIFYIIDGTASDSNFAGTLEKVKAALPHDVKLPDMRAVPDAIDEVAKIVADRQAVEQPGSPSVYVFIYGLQRYRVLRKSEDDYSSSFSMSDSDEPKKPKTDKQFAEILREGPPNGVHVIAWVDTMVSIDRTFDRGAMREFDNRVLFQMSAADSSSLIDSPNANKLGYHKALVYSEEQGTIERFRPYAMPETDWLMEVKKKLTRS
jgi:S-DNA-T family DNA segregation ATPase FtsK/SpoIIIE